MTERAGLSGGDNYHKRHSTAQKMSEDKETYLRRRGIELQSSLVNVKTTPTSTVESCIWTYRTTSCDVISLITTTVPLKNGAMNDLRYVNKEMKRYNDQVLPQPVIVVPLLTPLPTLYAITYHPSPITRYQHPHTTGSRRPSPNRAHSSPPIRC